MTDYDAEIARLHQQIRDLEVARIDEQLARRPVYQVGDQVRVLSDSRAGPKAPHIGDVATIVAVYPKADINHVFFSLVDRGYLLDFGPDEDRYQGRDTWLFADGDVGPVEEQPKRQRRKR